jgi:hypothetical protein
MNHTFLKYHENTWHYVDLQYWLSNAAISYFLEHYKKFITTIKALQRYVPTLRFILFCVDKIISTPHSYMPVMTPYIFWNTHIKKLLKTFILQNLVLCSPNEIHCIPQTI